MLIASKNQIDHSGGYVNNWNTREYSDFIERMKKKYEYSNVKKCRDHCGPGFNGIMVLDDTYRTIESDIENGFDLIHIDLCHHQGFNGQRLEESKKAIKQCLDLNPNILIEIGTDENVGSKFSINSLEEIEDEIDYFKNICDPEFYVVQTGSLVKEINQLGTFNSDFIEKSRDILHERDVKLKEHNADYLSMEEIFERHDIVDALNIAPQLGVVQTSIVLDKCLTYGVRFDDFVDKVYRGKKWKKWLHNNSHQNIFLCSLIAGHYHFASDEYKAIVEKLNQHEDIYETIIEKIIEVIEHYESSQKTLGKGSLA